MNAAIYARAAHSMGYSLETQIDQAKRFTASNGYQVAAVYSEIGSGLDRNPQFAKLLDDAGAGSFEAVIVTDLSRIARSFTHMEHELRALAQHNVKLIDTQGTDLIMERQEFVKLFSAAMRREHGKRVAMGKTHAKMKRTQEGKKGAPNTERER